MRTLAVASGARTGHQPARTEGRVAGFLARLGALGAVDLVVVHDEGSDAASRSAAVADLVPGPAVGVARTIEVAAPALPTKGFIREVHLHRSDRPELTARALPWFVAADAFVTGAPDGVDLAWCADTDALTRAGWLRRALPTVLDVDRVEDLSSLRTVRTARRAAATAHLVTVVDEARHDELALPGSLVADPDDPRLLPAVRAVVEQAAAYRPVRTR